MLPFKVFDSREVFTSSTFIGFSTEQLNRIKALVVLGVPMKTIRQRFDCSLKSIKAVLKDYPLEMTEQEAVKLLLDN